MRSESVGLLSFHIPDCYWLDKFAMLSASFLTSLDSWADSRKLSQTDLVSDRGQERGRGENTKNVSLIRYVTPGIFAGLWLVSSAKYCPLIGWSGSHSNLHRVTLPAISDSHRSSSALSHIRACARGRFALFSNLSKVSDVICNLCWLGNSIIQNKSWKHGQYSMDKLLIRHSTV